MTVTGGSKKHTMLPETLTKKKKSKTPVSEKHALHALPEGFELGCESSSREVEQEGLLWLHCRRTCTRDSLKFNLLGTLKEYKESCGAGKVFDTGSHKFVIHSVKSWPLKLARNMELPAVRCLSPKLIYVECLPELSHRARLIFLVLPPQSAELYQG